MRFPEEARAKWFEPNDHVRERAEKLDPAEITHILLRGESFVLHPELASPPYSERQDMQPRAIESHWSINGHHLTREYTVYDKIIRDPKLIEEFVQVLRRATKFKDRPLGWITETIGRIEFHLADGMEIPFVLPPDWLMRYGPEFERFIEPYMEDGMFAYAKRFLEHR